MLSKNVSFKCSEGFIHKTDKSKTFNVEVCVKSNHILDITTLNTIETQLLQGLKTNLYDYSLQKKQN